MKLVALLVAAVVALGTAASSAPSTPINSPREASEPWVLSLPGHPDVRFSAYDFRQSRLSLPGKKTLYNRNC